MSFWDRLNELMDEKNLSQKELATKVGIAQPSISCWSKGTLPNATTTIKIAKFLDVSIEYLIMGGERTQYPINPYRDMNLFPENPNKYLEDIQFYKINNSTDSLSYENPAYAIHEEGIPIPKPLIGQHNPIMLRIMEVSGDSMINIQIFSGDLVYFLLSDKYSDGLNVILDGDKLYVRRIRIDIGDEITIISENDKYPDKVLTVEEMKRLQVVGKVVGWLHSEH